MCLSMIQHPDSVRHIADKRITVYKIIRMDNTSWFRKFQYEPNTEYVCEELRPHWVGSTVMWQIEEGFHAYQTRKCAAGNRMLMIMGRCRGMKIVEFIIPEGTTYYLGTKGELACNRIVSGSLEPL